MSVPLSITERLPPPRLAQDVEVIRITRSQASAPFQVKTCPNGTPGLVYQRGDEGPALLSIETRSKKSTAVPSLFLHGQGTEPSVMSFSGLASVIAQVVLKPQGLFTIFGREGPSLVLNHLTPPQFEGEELQTALDAAETDEAIFDQLYGFLAGRKARSGRQDRKVEEALSLASNDPATNLEALAMRLDLSPRQLQRRFLRVVGCPLKTFLRLRRANLALGLIQQGAYRRLTDIAYALHYADQSHFIRDIKAFTWLVPRRLGLMEGASRDGVGYTYR